MQLHRKVSWLLRNIELLPIALAERYSLIKALKFQWLLDLHQACLDSVCGNSSFVKTIKNTNKTGSFYLHNTAAICKKSTKNNYRFYQKYIFLIFLKIILSIQGENNMQVICLLKRILQYLWNAHRPWSQSAWLHVWCPQEDDTHRRGRGSHRCVIKQYGFILASQT